MAFSKECGGSLLWMVPTSPLDTAAAFSSAVLRRTAAPLQELAEDAASALEELLGLPAASIGGVFDSRTSGSSSSGSRVLSVYTALSELAEGSDGSSGTEKTGSALRVLLPATVYLLAAPSLSAMGPAAVMLCGVSVPTKVLYGTVSLVMAVTAYSVLNRHPEELERSMHRRGALALVACSGLHLAFTLMADSQLPAPLSKLAYPEVAMHFLEDFIASPLLILNLGYLAGQKPRQMVPCICYNLIATSGALGAAVSPDELQRALFLITNACFTGMASSCIGSLPGQAATLGNFNRLRVQVSGDLMIFSWTLYPVVQGLGLLSILNVPGQLRLFAGLDVLSKLGACHIMFRNREAIVNASRYLAASGADAAAEGPQARQEPQEPQSEPPPQGQACY
mmetsp:Transcript_94758/g.203585  ORF Transcript_94758/g.203585 Transcript_94758/m.203585 type:complete len:395 (+) Transcript_94758:68-1252(+)